MHNESPECWKEFCFQQQRRHPRQQQEWRYSRVVFILHLLMARQRHACCKTTAEP
jgi:hypothetical protein